MNSKNDAFSILERHVPDYLLRDYTDGVLSPEKNKLYGFALTEIVPDQDDQYSYINEFSFYSTMGSEPEKEKHIAMMETLINLKIRNCVCGRVSINSLQ